MFTIEEFLRISNQMRDYYAKDTFNKLGYKAKINTYTTSCIN